MHTVVRIALSVTILLASIALVAAEDVSLSPPVFLPDGACRACALLSSCSRCPAQALVETGDLLGPLPVACERAAMVGEILAERASARPDPPDTIR